MKVFSFEESAVLEQAIQEVIDMKDSLEQTCHHLKIDLEALPAVTIKSEKLYKVLICFEELYKRVLEYKLLQTGNTSKSRKIH